MQPSAAIPSHPETSNARAEDLAPLKALARALGRQAAGQMWAEAMQQDSTVASPETVSSKQARPRAPRRRAAR